MQQRSSSAYIHTNAEAGQKMQMQLSVAPGILSALHPSDALLARLLGLNFKACRLILQVEGFCRPTGLEQSTSQRMDIHLWQKSRRSSAQRLHALLLVRQVGLQSMHFQTGTFTQHCLKRRF